MLREMAGSADPAERAKARYAINRMPSLAPVVGKDLLRKLRDDVAGAGR
jgi:hypothetical protein